MNDEIRDEQKGYVCRKCRKYIPFCEHASFKHRCMNDLCWNFYDMCKECYQEEIQKACHYEYLFCNQCDNLIKINETLIMANEVLCAKCHEKNKEEEEKLKNDELLIAIKKICVDVCEGTKINPMDLFKKNFKSLLDDCKNKLNKEII